MFRKAQVSSSNKLRGSDVKGLKKAAQLALPHLTESEIDSIIPSKADIYVVKVNHRAVVYSINNGNPILFDPEGDGELFPTVYLIWQFPKCLPSVSPKVLGGADLMLPGFIMDDAQDWEQGQKMVCSVKEHPFPFAVGFMEQSSKASRDSGMKGRGLKVLHHYPDMLWAMGDKSTPDPSFAPTRIFPVGQGPAGAAAAAADKASEKVAALEIAAEAAPAPPASPSRPAADASADRPAGSAEAFAPPPPGDPATPDGMDKCLDYALLRAIASSADGDIPCQFEKFYSGNILPNRHPGTQVDVKKSGYKKLAKLFSTWEKKGVLTTKVVHKQDTIIAVNKGHKDVVAAAESLRASAGADDAPAASSGASAGAAASNAAHIQAVPVYRVPSSLRPLTGEAADKDHLYTAGEIFALLDAYGKANGLLPDGEPSKIKVDAFLVSLYNKKEREEIGSLAVKEDVRELLLSRLQMFTKLIVTRNGRSEEVLKKGDIKNIHVQVEDRHAGRKFITKVTGLEYFGIDPEEFSTTLQKKYNTSASVGDLPGKNETGKEVAVQGNLLEEIIAFLEKAYGITQAYIDSTNKTKA